MSFHSEQFDSRQDSMIKDPREQNIDEETIRIISFCESNEMYFA